jgi:hypothetical protein
MFKLNLALWNEHFDPQRLKFQVGTLANGAPMTHLARFDISATRERLKQLRFAFALFDQDHRQPPVLNELTNRLGALKDADENGATAVLREEATALFNFLTPVGLQVLQNEIQTFHPGSMEGFRVYIRAQIEFLSEDLKRPDLAGEEFHEMRRVIGRFMALFNTMDTLSPSFKTRQAVEFLSTLNGRMGRRHDQLIAAQFAGTYDYKTRRIKLPDDIRYALFAFVNTFEI